MYKFRYIIAILACVLAACSSPVTPVEPETEDDGMRHDSLTEIYDLFCNPERGFHVFKEFHSPNPEQLTAGGIKTIYDMGYSLVLNNYYLKDYRNCAIPDSYLEVVRNNMQALRDGGCKCILRFAYTDNESQTPREAPVDTVLKHISQIKPILQEYADVIFAMEAGFVGTWGEWYYTTYFKHQPSAREDFVDRRRVLDALLDALPKERMICVRTPDFKRSCFGYGLKDTITLAEAFNGSDKSRIACHDDAFMADETDMGTFTVSADRAYWEAETKYTIYGGESCRTGKYASCDNSLAQMQAMHISYLNISYHKGVISGWQNQGCLEDMRRLIGYRLVCTDVATTKEPKAGEDLKVKLTIINEGFSSPKNPRDIAVMLVNADDPDDVASFTPDCDPRFWFPEGEHYVEARFKPEKSGNYKIYLNLPDPKPTLAGNPKFSIRLANKDCWESATGYNYLTTVEVK
ncbi:MAG: DUF4832 domain-containing protein [Paludibacteraceae bacterium]|nr:DUF4832 domain-containing protein [Paludibacteraceae bacterium]